MARAKNKAATVNGAKPESKMDGARQLLERNPKITAAELSSSMKSEFGMDLDPRSASSYRYSIIKKRGKITRSRKATVAPVARERLSVISGRSNDEGGLDDLLRAAQKLGWKRVKEVVDGIIEAPG
jgi:hypothetical protein